MTHRNHKVTTASVGLLLALSCFRFTFQLLTMTDINDKGLELIKHFESCRLKAYPCPSGIWTIGYGHTNGVKPGDTLTTEQAQQMLTDDLKSYVRQTAEVCRQMALDFNDDQFSALVSFCYNCGAGALRRMLTQYKAGEPIERAMYKYRYSKGRELPGLVRRRKAEAQLFLTGQLQFDFK